MIETQENSASSLRWVGPWYGLLTGTHSFDFLPVASDPNQTRLVQTETFSGILAPTMNNPNWLGGYKTFKAFEMVNGDMKVAAEKRWKEELGR